MKVLASPGRIPGLVRYAGPPMPGQAVETVLLTVIALQIT